MKENLSTISSYIGTGVKNSGIALESLKVT